MVQDSASSLLELIEAATRSPSAEPTLGQIHHALSLARGGDVSALVRFILAVACSLPNHLFPSTTGLSARYTNSSPVP
jgi:hypothetical protein